MGLEVTLVVLKAFVLRIILSGITLLRDPYMVLGIELGWPCTRQAPCLPYCLSDLCTTVTIKLGHRIGSNILDLLFVWSFGLQLMVLRSPIQFCSGVTLRTGAGKAKRNGLV